eukprot:Opistho-2@66236
MADANEEPRPKYRIATEIVALEKTIKDAYNPASTPIYQTATFKQDSAASFGEYDYTRSGNPTRSVLESHVARLCGGTHAYAVSSGMSALDVILRTLKSGDEIVAGTDIYGGTNRLLKFMENQKIYTRHVDVTNLEQISAAMTPATRIVLIETPTNPLIRVTDLRAVAQIAHRGNALLVVDNTMMSPYLQRPLELGADIEYHSATKYLSGHHDLMAGVVVTKDERIAKDIYFVINAVGCGLAPFDCWLLLRGVKTLSVRMERQQENAQKVAEYLDGKVLKVNYPGLPSYPQRNIHFAQATGAGAVLSFETGSTMVSQQIVEACRLFSISVSFGCINSLISMPCRMSHASIPADVRKAREMPEDLIRLCIGIEDHRDLIDDLRQALIAANCIDADAEADLGHTTGHVDDSTTLAPAPAPAVATNSL